MAALTNTQISVTYVGLLKTTGSTVLSSTAQQITDGSGNNSILYLSTAGVGIGGAAASGKELDVTGNVLVTGDLIVDNIKIDGNTISAESGVVTLSNGAIATTQSQNDNSTKIATTAYVDTAIDGVDTLAEILAIGNTTGATKISVNNTSSGIDFIDDAKARFGTGNDAEIYGSSDHLYIDQNTADKDIILRSDDGSGGITEYYRLDGSSAVNIFSKNILYGRTSTLGSNANKEIQIYDGTSSAINIAGGDYDYSWVAHSGGTFKLLTGSTELLEFGSSIGTSTETSALMISSGNLVSKRTLGSNAFNSTAFVDGSGTANDVVMWSDSNTLTDAPIAISSNDATFAGNVALGDNKELIFGAATDYKIYHNSTTNVNHISSLIDRQLSLNANNIFLTNQANDSTFLQLSSTAATFGVNVLINKASNPTSLQIGSSLADDPFIVFQTDGNTMSMGIDRSDSNKFVISDNATLGTNNRFTIDTSGDATFAGSVTTGTGLKLYTDGSGNGIIYNLGQDKDLYFVGDDGGTGINALVFDMSEGGNATFAGNVGINNLTNSDYDADADNLVLGATSGNTGITIRSGSSAGNYGSIYFADGTSGTALKAGYIRYEQNTSKMTIGINAVEKIAIALNGDTTFAGTITSGAITTSGLLRNTLAINQSSLPNAPSEHVITLNPPTTTNYYGGGISWSEGSNTAASLGVYDAGTGGALGFYIATGNNTTLTQALTIDNSQNVGIGSTNVDSKFKVELNPSGTVLAGLRIGYNSSSANYFDGDTQYFRNGAGTTERMRITSGGDLCVGVTTAQGKIHMHNSGTSYLHISNDTTGSGSGSGTDIGVFTGQSDLQINNREAASVIISTSDTPRLTIDSSGNSTFAKQVIIQDNTSQPLSGLFEGTLVVQGSTDEDPIIAVTDVNTASAAAAVFHQSATSPSFPAFVINAASNGNAQPLISARTNVNNTSGLAGTEVFAVDGGGNATFAGNVIIHNSSNAPYIDFVESGATTDSKARITMDQVNTDNASLIFSTEGSGNLSERMRIDPAGVLQIGITASQSQARLNVRENGSGIEFGHTNTSNYFYGTLGSFGSSGVPFISFSCMNEHNANTWTTQGLAGNIINGDSLGNLLFQQVTALNTTGQTPVERMRITSAGRLLIGVTSNVENGLVQVHGDKNLVSGIPQGLLQVSDTDSQAQGVGGGINFTGKYLDNGTHTSFGSIESYKENGTSGNYGASMLFKTRENGGNQTEKIRITSTGLISFNGSGQTLNMNIPGSQRQQLELSGGLSNEFNFNNSSNTGSDTISFSDPDGDNAGKISYSHNTDSLAFITNSSERITIDSSGQVGISATTPISQLDVSGNINQRHSASTTNNGAFKNIQNLGVAGWLDQTASAGRIKVYGYENGNVNVSYCEYYVIRSSTGYHIQQIGTRLDVGNTNGHIEVQVSGNFLQVRNVAQSSLGIVRVVFSGMKN